MGAICSLSESPISPLRSPPSSPSPLSLQAFTKLRDNGALIIDCRKYNEVRKMIIPGSVPLYITHYYMREICQALIPKDKKLILVLKSDDQPEKDIRDLRQDGYTVQGYLDGGFKTWIEAGYPVYKRKQLAFKTYQNKVRKPVVVDILTEAEEKHYTYLKGARPFNFEELPNRYNELPKDQPFYVHCPRSESALAIYCVLLNMGFTNIVGTIEGMLSARDKEDRRNDNSSEASDDDSEPQGYTAVSRPVLKISPKDLQEAQQIADKVRTSAEDGSSTKFKEYKVLSCSTKLSKFVGTRGHLQYDIDIGIGGGKAIQVHVDEELSSTIGPLTLCSAMKPENYPNQNTSSPKHLEEAQHIADKVKTRAESIFSRTFKEYKVLSCFTNLYKPAGTRAHLRYDIHIGIGDNMAIQVDVEEELSSTIGPLTLRSTQLLS